MFQVKAKLLRNQKIKGNYLRCRLDALKIARSATPGQFVNIKLTDNREPLLRRPFSVHRAEGRNIEILYEVVGKGTEILAQKKPGEYLDIIGPLGNGFDYSAPVLQFRRRRTRLRRGSSAPVLVAGGMGVAPLLFLAEELVKRAFSAAPRAPLVLIGARAKDELLCENDFRKLGCGVKIATDDGSRGFKGRVTELLKHLPSTVDRRPSTVYACGPRPMLQEVSRISREYKIPAQVSLEEHMACGIGACLGCVVNTADGYKRVCKEGPVFQADEIIWSHK
jgi:dihydroorotate dehydrogenase electron transfer subunit